MTNPITDKFYDRGDFLALPSLALVNEGVLRAAIEALVMPDPPAFITLLQNTPSAVSLQVRWDGSVPPSSADIAAVTAVVAAHTGLATTSAPQQFENLGNVDATGNGVFVPIFDLTTPPLDAGTYLVLVATELSMPAVVANTAVQAEFRIGPGSGVLIGRTTFASATQPGGFDPHAMLVRSAGQTMRLLVQHAKLGAAAATARASNSRLSYCRVA